MNTDQTRTRKVVLRRLREDEIPECFAPFQRGDRGSIYRVHRLVGIRKVTVSDSVFEAGDPVPGWAVDRLLARSRAKSAGEPLIVEILAPERSRSGGPPPRKYKSTR